MTRLTASDVEIADLERMLRISVRDSSLLKAALTHRSALRAGSEATYERLEFLGDAVVGVVASELLYRRLPALSEGDLSARRARVVSRSTLAEAAKRAGLSELPSVRGLLATLGERAETSVLADIVEAVVGAVFLERGYRSARALVTRLLRSAFKAVLAEDASLDAKSELQRRTQAIWKELPAYEVERCDGADHRPVFRARVVVHGALCGVGEGRSKKEAEQNAAAQALLTIDSGRDEEYGSTG